MRMQSLAEFAVAAAVVISAFPGVAAFFSYDDDDDDSPFSSYYYSSPSYTYTYYSYYSYCDYPGVSSFTNDDGLNDIDDDEHAWIGVKSYSELRDTLGPQSAAGIGLLITVLVFGVAGCVKRGDGEALGEQVSTLLRAMSWFVQFIVFALELTYIVRVTFGSGYYNNDDDSIAPDGWSYGDPLPDNYKLPRKNDPLYFFDFCTLNLVIPAWFAIIFSFLALFFRPCACACSETGCCGGRHGNCGLSNPDGCCCRGCCCPTTKVQSTVLAMNVVAVCFNISTLTYYWAYFGYVFAAMFLHVALIVMDVLVIGGRLVPHSEGNNAGRGGRANAGRGGGRGGQANAHANPTFAYGLENPQYNAQQPYAAGQNKALPEVPMTVVETRVETAEKFGGFNDNV